MELLIRVLLLVLFVASIAFFYELGKVNWEMYKKAKEFGNYSDGWNDGCPPTTHT